MHGISSHPHPQPRRLVRDLASTQQRPAGCEGGVYRLSRDRDRMFASALNNRDESTFGLITDDGAVHEDRVRLFWLGGNKDRSEVSGPPRCHHLDLVQLITSSDLRFIGMGGL